MVGVGFLGVFSAVVAGDEARPEAVAVYATSGDAGLASSQLLAAGGSESVSGSVDALTAALAFSTSSLVPSPAIGVLRTHTSYDVPTVSTPFGRPLSAPCGHLPRRYSAGRDDGDRDVELTFHVMGYV